MTAWCGGLSRLIWLRAIVSAATLQIAICDLARAQSAPPPQPETGAEKRAPGRDITAWLSGGIAFGTASVGGQGADSGRVEASLAYGHQMLSLRYGYTQENACDGIICFGAPSPPLSDKELALLYGIKARIPALLASASVGPSVLWTVQRGAAGAVDRVTGGLAAELGISLSAPFIGIGPTLFVNVNPVQSTWGFLVLDVHIGFMGFAHGGPHIGPPAPVH